MKLLSIIVPIYNSEKWLGMCIDSIISAVGDKSEYVEILLIDDGSNDGTAEIIDNYTSNYDWINAYHKENGGVASARNYGLKYASGEYIAWIDSDDWVEDKWFVEINNVIHSNKPDIIVYDSIINDLENTKEIYGRDKGFVERDVFFKDVARDIRIKSGFPNKIIRSELYKGVLFDEKEPILEDYQVIFEVISKADLVYYIPMELYNYRQQENSLLHTHSPEKSFRCVEIAAERRKKLPEKYRDAALVGTAVQMNWFCRARAYDQRYNSNVSQYDRCVNYMRKHLRTLLSDREVPYKWKLKFIALAFRVLPIIVKIKIKVNDLNRGLNNVKKD